MEEASGVQCTQADINYCTAIVGLVGQDLQAHMMTRNSSSCANVLVLGKGSVQSCAPKSFAALRRMPVEESFFLLPATSQASVFPILLCILTWRVDRSFRSASSLVI